MLLSSRTAMALIRIQAGRFHPATDPFPIAQLRSLQQGASWPTFNLGRHNFIAGATATHHILQSRPIRAGVSHAHFHRPAFAPPSKLGRLFAFGCSPSTRLPLLLRRTNWHWCAPLTRRWIAAKRDGSAPQARRSAQARRGTPLCMQTRFQ